MSAPQNSEPLAAALRDYVMDFASRCCDDLLTCGCSAALALRLVQTYDPDAAQAALEQEAAAEELPRQSLFTAALAEVDRLTEALDIERTRFQRVEAQAAAADELASMFGPPGVSEAFALSARSIRRALAGDTEGADL